MIESMSVKKITDLKWLNMFEAEYRIAGDYSTSAPKRWQFASRKRMPSPGTQPLSSDAVVIVPLLKVGRQRRLVITSELRVPIGDRETGFPAGLREPGETEAQTAIRELKEEAGLDATRVLVVSSPLLSSAGMSDEAVAYVFVECTGMPTSAGAEATEDITVEVLDMDGIRALRRSQRKLSARAWPILLLFEALGRIALPKGMTGWPASGDLKL